MKTMKKSMFITTIMMVVLLVVALSTATFAWYTAQSNVTATKTIVTSASSNSASLVIDTSAVTDVNANNSSVDLTVTASNSNVPLIYYSAQAPVAGVAYNTFRDSFYTMNVTNDGRIVESVTSTTSAGTITTVKGSETAAATQNYFVLTNVGGNVVTSLKTIVKIDADNYVATTVTTGASVAGLYTLNNNIYTVLGADAVAEEGTTYYTKTTNNNLRVAVFAGTDANSMVLKGVYGNNVKYTSTLAKNDDTNPLKAGENANTALAQQDFGSLVKASEAELEIATNVSASAGSGSAVFVSVVVWFEGSAMNNSLAGTAAHFTMSFTA